MTLSLALLVFLGTGGTTPFPKMLLRRRLRDPHPRPLHLLGDDHRAAAARRVRGQPAARQPGRYVREQFGYSS